MIVAGAQPLVRAGLVRLLETSEPSAHVLGELATIEDLTEAVSLLQPDMIVLDEALLGQYAEARVTSGDSVERPVVAVVDHFADELLAVAASSGVRGFLSLSSTPAEVARVVVAARGDALLDGAMFTRLTESRAADTGEAISLTPASWRCGTSWPEGWRTSRLPRASEFPSRPWMSTWARCSGRPEPAITPWR